MKIHLDKIVFLRIIINGLSRQSLLALGERRVLSTSYTHNGCNVEVTK
jgi:hypothetical protein